jgi:hypothetical protein
MAAQLLGKHLLVGLTYLNDDGTVERQKQLHGDVIRADEDGVAILLSSGEHYSLPPDLRPYKQAAPGEYRLRSTGEVLIDPDYIANWTVTQGRDS